MSSRARQTSGRSAARFAASISSATNLLATSREAALK